MAEWSGAPQESRGTLPNQRFGEGDKVRMHGLDQFESTWNGAEGIVEHVDSLSGRYHVCLGDGRVKEVYADNLEPQSRPPRPSPRFAQMPGEAFPGGRPSGRRITAAEAAAANPSKALMLHTASQSQPAVPSRPRARSLDSAGAGTEVVLYNSSTTDDADVEAGEQCQKASKNNSWPAKFGLRPRQSRLPSKRNPQPLQDLSSNVGRALQDAWHKTG